MNRYTILLFARLKELADTSAVEIDLDEGAKVADLRRKLGEQVPALAPLLKHCLFAVNDAYADESMMIPMNAEIACIPPVSGG
jgi:sulfur-carrier protein